MEGSIVNTTISTSVIITQAQIVSTAVIGSILFILVVLNLVMYSIYKKLTKVQKVSIKISKQESVQLYQVKSTGEYNSLSHASINQSRGRTSTVRTISLSGDDMTSVDYSIGDMTQSYNPNKSTDSASAQEASYQLDTSKDTHTSQQFESNQSNPSNPQPDKATLASVETEAQIHKDSLPRNSQGLSDIHLYQCFRLQIEHKKSRRNSKSDHKVVKHPGGIAREAPIELHSSKTKPHHKVKGYVDMTDFDNDTDTEVNILTSVDSGQAYPGASQLLDSQVSVLGRPVVEFQNKAFEFSETKTALEEVADTDL